jgi:hypothetical protein
MVVDINQRLRGVLRCRSSVDSSWRIPARLDLYHSTVSSSDGDYFTLYEVAVLHSTILKEEFPHVRDSLITWGGKISYPLF